jgi:hypothetical protein
MAATRSGKRQAKGLGSTTPQKSRLQGDGLEGLPVALFCLILVARLAHVPAKWNPVRRQGHAPTRESTALRSDIGSPSDPISLGSAVGWSQNKFNARFRGAIVMLHRAKRS